MILNKISVKNIISDTIKSRKGLLFLLLFTVVCVVSFSLVPPQILKKIVDEYLVTKNGKNLLQPALFYFLALVFIGISDFAKEIQLTILGQRINHRIRTKMMEKTRKLPVDFFTKNSTGAIVSRLTNDVDSIMNLFTNGIISMAIDSLKIVGIIASIWFFSWKLGAMVLILLPGIYAITRYFQKNMLKVQILNRICIERVNNHIPESIKNIQMIRAFSKQEYMEEKYKKYLVDSYGANEKVNFYDSVFSPIILVIRAAVIAVIAIFSTQQLRIFGLSVGMVAAAIELISNIFTPIENLGMELQNIQQSVAGIKRVNDFFEEKEEQNEVSLDLKHLENSKDSENSTCFYDYAKKDITIKFDHLNFAYAEGQEIFRDVTFTILPKENITFSGRTGAGKSTLFKLLLGLLEPVSGTITIGGIDVLSIPNSKKRSLYGYVEQNFHFIMGSVREQITLKDESIPVEKVIETMEFVGLNNYVLGFSQGYDTPCHPNMFSKGQQQLLSIARAIITDPPILLLDEMTANLDAKTEEEIVAILEKAGNERTTLSISHRKSACTDRTKIVFLKEGKMEATQEATQEQHGKQ